jgi:hypothetical protein
MKQACAKASVGREMKWRRRFWRQSSVAGAVLSVPSLVAFKEDVSNLFRLVASKNNEYLLGTWKCTWETLAPKPRPQIQDTVDITLVRGRILKGKGSNSDFGEWDLEGRTSHLAVSFSYTGRKKNQNLPGAIVLKASMASHLAAPLLRS